LKQPRLELNNLIIASRRVCTHTSRQEICQWCAPARLPPWLESTCLNYRSESFIIILGPV